MTLVIFDIRVTAKFGDINYWIEFEDKFEDKKKARFEGMT